LKVRFAGPGDLEGLARMWSELPNASMYGNLRFLRDVLERLYRAGAVMVVAGNDKLVGGMVLAHSDALKGVVSLQMVLRAVAGFYGSRVGLLRNFRRSRLLMGLIENTFHGVFVYVEPGHRGRRVSVRMWELAKTKLHGEVTLLIDDGNEVSGKWAVKMGFKAGEMVGFAGREWVIYSKETP
jgi:hypothetical protein